MTYAVHLVTLFVAGVVCIVALRQLGVEERARTKRALCGVVLLSTLHIGMKLTAVLPQFKEMGETLHPLWAPIDLLNLVVLLAMVRAVKRKPRE